MKFYKVIDYRKYRSRDRRSSDLQWIKISKNKPQGDGLKTTLEAFNGTLNISLLKYLATLHEAFDAVGSPEATELRTITCYF